MWDWVAGAVRGDLSPKPADREHDRDHEGHQFKPEVTRAQLARLDVLNEFSDESHGVKKYGLRHDDGHCRKRVTDDTARRHGIQILGVILMCGVISHLVKKFVFVWCSIVYANITHYPRDAS